jgi:D-tyrosyl-tRNA(Tyr) deacylase
MRQVLVHLGEIVEERNLPYSVSYEATHHGPTDLPIRSCFVELGSTEEEWTDDEAADAVAEAVHRSLAARTSAEPFMGIGGTHYAPKFTSFSLHQPYAAGHIIPKYAADLVGEDLILQALEKSDETNLVVVEKKGLNSDQRERFAGMFDKWGVEQILI